MWVNLIVKLAYLCLQCSSALKECYVTQTVCQLKHAFRKPRISIMSGSVNQFTGRIQLLAQQRFG